MNRVACSNKMHKVYLQALLAIACCANGFEEKQSRIMHVSMHLYLQQIMLPQGK